MLTMKRSAILVMSGVLLGGMCARGWAADNKAPEPASVEAADSGDKSLLGILAPLLSAPAAHKARNDCKPDQLYSRHDVVGDPEACFMGRLVVTPGSNSVGFGGPAF